MSEQGRTRGGQTEVSGRRQTWGDRGGDKRRHGRAGGTDSMAMPEHKLTRVSYIQGATMPPSASETGVSDAVLTYGPGHNPSPDIPLHVPE